MVFGAGLRVEHHGAAAQRGKGAGQTDLLPVVQPALAGRCAVKLRYDDRFHKVTYPCSAAGGLRQAGQVAGVKNLQHLIPAVGVHADDVRGGQAGNLQTAGQGGAEGISELPRRARNCR